MKLEYLAKYSNKLLDTLRDSAVGTIGLASPNSLAQRHEISKLRRELERVDREARLAKLLRHACSTSPFYRDRANGTSLTDFPVLTKATLRDQFYNLLSRDRRGRLMRGRLSITSTSGSTGSPTVHLKQLRRESAAGALFLEALWRDFSLPRRGEIIDVGLRRPGQRPRELRLFPGVFFCWNLPKLNPRDARVRQLYTAAANAAKPTIVFGAPSRAAELARFAARNRLPWSPRIVVTTYEPLSADQVAVINDAWRAPVISAYGTAETGLIGWGSQSGDMAFLRQFAWVELLDESGQEAEPDSYGRIVVTSLTALAMPIIRYDTGDLALVPAMDGHRRQGAPVSPAVIGRRVDNFVTTRGRVFHPYCLLEMIRATACTDYQLVQSERGVAQLLTRTLDDPHELSQLLTRRASQHLGETFVIEVDATRPFVLSPSGKRDPAVSLLAR